MIPERQDRTCHEAVDTFVFCMNTLGVDRACRVAQQGLLPKEALRDRRVHDSLQRWEDWAMRPKAQQAMREDAQKRVAQARELLGDADPFSSVEQIRWRARLVGMRINTNWQSKSY